MEKDAQKRLVWVKLYEKTKDAGVVCRKCGISRPTLRKWWKRYQESGDEGLNNKTKRPKHTPSKKVLEQHEKWILELRQERKLGARRIQSELERQHNYSLSLSTIQKVLQKHQVKPLSRIRRHKEVKRYQCDLPGERVQMDTCKIGPGVYQYTAVDDCTRYKVVAVFSRISAENTLQFLEKLIEEMPFPIQRIQTDRGREFFAYQVQETLMEWGIKFRPIRPRSPHLNGKVERAQRTDLEEFYSTVSIKQPDLEDRLREWQHYYNWDRVHGSIGKPPIDKYFELSSKTPFWDEVIEKFDPAMEHIQEQDFKSEEMFRKLKRSL